MTRSETTSTKAWKLCMFCINSFSQQARWPKGRNKMGIGGKKLFYFIWLWFYKNGIKPDWNYSVKSITFQCDGGCICPSICLWHATKDIIYAWLVHRWIVNRVSWTSKAPCSETMFIFRENVDIQKNYV